MPKEETAKEKKARKNISKDPRYRIITGLLLLLLALFLFVAFTSYLFTWKIDQSFVDWEKIFSSPAKEVANWAGKAGAWLAQLFITRWFGIAAFAVPFLLGLCGLQLLGLNPFPSFIRTVTLTVIGMILFSVLCGFFFNLSFGYLKTGLGGGHGYYVAQWLSAFIGKIGTGLFLLLATFTYLIFTFKGLWEYLVSLFTPAPATPSAAEEIPSDKTENSEAEAEEETTLSDTNSIELTLEKTSDDTIFPAINNEEPLEGIPEEYAGISSDEEELPEEILARFGPYDPHKDLPGYKFPPIDLLTDHKSGNVEVSQEELQNNKNKILETLKNYKIDIDKIKATIGPTVTLYEIIPAPGVRISKIKNLEDDIALSLSALGIRIIAPIPGKGTIGIEVPNRNPEIVSMRSVIASKKFQESIYELPIALGKTISNETLVADLARMPHLLIAGATGQGKSVGINAIITSLLYKKHPSELKFVMVDPKKVELALYNKLEKHYLAKLPGEEEPIITDFDKVKNTLASLVIEMENRYELLKRAGVRNIKEYNTKFIERRLNPEKGHRFLEYIVLVVDEFADLISAAGKEIELPIARLAQKARAIGIHLIIATQRPSTNVITGVIKANFPSRIAFRVVSMVDSRTILDQPGANQLIGRGDMLLMTGSDIIRAQCAFVDTPEVEKLTDFIGRQKGYPDAMYLPEPPSEGNEEGLLSGDPGKLDPLFADAARLIVSQQQGSTSLIQRKFSIGYNRAGRIMDQLYAKGIVGPSEGSKARQVLITDLDALENFLRSIEQ